LTAISLTDLNHIIERDLALCSDEERAFFRRIAFSPARWRHSLSGDRSGFCAIGTTDDHVLWYNDIEEGFNVSRFTRRGMIPAGEYGCNQDSLQWALRRLMPSA
jgi:hypothetical protein